MNHKEDLGFITGVDPKFSLAEHLRSEEQRGENKTSLSRSLIHRVDVNGGRGFNNLMVV